jgi:hypothetical protein
LGALSGTLTTTAYYIEGDVPDGFRETYIEALSKFRFKEIDLGLDQDESLGWVTIADPFDTAFELNKVSWGSYLMVAIRHDAIRLPANAFKLHLGKAVQEYLREHGKERISKPEQEEIKDQLQKQLRKRVLPAIKTFDLVWNIERRQAWFFTQNKKMNELFVDMFEETFGLQAHERNPYSLVEHMGLDDAMFDRMLSIEPAALAAPPR